MPAIAGERGSGEGRSLSNEELGSVGVEDDQAAQAPVPGGGDHDAPRIRGQESIARQGSEGPLLPVGPHDIEQDAEVVTVTRESANPQLLASLRGHPKLAGLLEEESPLSGDRKLLGSGDCDEPEQDGDCLLYTSPSPRD